MHSACLRMRGCDVERGFINGPPERHEQNASAVPEMVEMAPDFSASRAMIRSRKPASELRRTASIHPPSSASALAETLGASADHTEVRRACVRGSEPSDFAEVDSTCRDIQAGFRLVQSRLLIRVGSLARPRVALSGRPPRLFRTRGKFDHRIDARKESVPRTNQAIFHYFHRRHPFLRPHGR